MKMKSFNLVLLGVIVLSLPITAAFASTFEKTLLDNDASFSTNKDKKGDEKSQGTENDQVVRPEDQIDHKEEGIIRVDTGDMKEEGINVVAADFDGDGFDNTLNDAGGNEGSFKVAENESPTAN